MEIWKNIKGYEGLYQVSNTGLIRSLNYRHKKKVRILKMGINTNGYYSVNLFNNGISKTTLVHRIVSFHFLENKEGKTQVNHKDLDKLNNNDWNLEWCTGSENVIHYRKHISL